MKPFRIQFLGFRVLGFRVWRFGTTLCTLLTDPIVGEGINPYVALVSMSFSILFSTSGEIPPDPKP